MRAPTGAFVVHVDGASSGNPGPAAAGVVIATADDGTIVHEEGYYLGRTTNNVAEYYALLIALEELLALRAASAIVHTDSELMVRQLTGRYKVKATGLKFVHARVKRLSSLLQHFKIRHVPREENGAADRLAREAVKEATRKAERR